VDAILNDRKALLNASALLNGEYGYRDIVMDVPVIIGKKGAEKIVELELTQEEKAELQKSYDTLRDAISKLNIELPKRG
jgi:malate dehydrogenase (NAD) (EC 1.1.1.37)